VFKKFSDPSFRNDLESLHERINSLDKVIENIITTTEMMDSDDVSKTKSTKTSLTTQIRNLPTVVKGLVKSIKAFNSIKTHYQKSLKLLNAEMQNCQTAPDWLIQSQFSAITSTIQYYNGDVGKKDLPKNYTNNMTLLTDLGWTTSAESDVVEDSTGTGHSYVHERGPVHGSLHQSRDFNSSHTHLERDTSESDSSSDDPDSSSDS
jgi:DNA repair ATPase RecN